MNLVIDDERFKKFINCENYDPLHSAIKSNISSVILKLIEKGQQITEDHIKNIELKTLEQILNKQVYCQSKNSKLVVKYDFLLQQSNSNNLQMNIPRYIAENKCLQTLGKHPVLKLFFEAKNYQYRYVNWLVFLSVTVSFIILLASFFRTKTTGNNKEEMNVFNLILQIPFLVVITLLELIQLCSLRNLKCLSTWMSILLIISTIMLFTTTKSEELHRIFTAVVLLLSTFKILTLINMLFDSYAVHTMLCLIVAKTFLKVFMIHMPILIAFGCSFYVIFAEKTSDGVTENPSNIEEEVYQSQFNNFHKLDGSILKTFVMFSGEFDASTMIIVGSWYKGILFLCFLMTQIVIYNLANALAIDDVEVLFGLLLY